MTESLKATLSTTPVLRIDTQAPLLELFDAASHRLQTSVDLLDTLATLSLSGVEGATLADLRLRPVCYAKMGLMCWRLCASVWPATLAAACPSSGKTETKKPQAFTWGFLVYKGWCTRRDSNPRPLPSEGSTLSS